MNPSKTLIFALPRTGSTSLAKAINAHTHRWCVIEPFTPGPNKREPVKNEADLLVRVSQIWQQYNAIKHIWLPCGWPFAGGMKLNKCLLSGMAEKVILLSRRNILRRVVSCELSMQVNIWYVSNSRSLKEFRASDFKALDAENIKRQLTEDVSFLAQWRTTLTDCGVEWMEVTYEDLYGTNGAREIEFFKVFQFLGMPKDHPSWPDISAVVDAPTARMNDTSTYRRIPNIDEIEEKAGADSTGWLFH
jgi:hypothetical protein